MAHFSRLCFYSQSNPAFSTVTACTCHRITTPFSVHIKYEEERDSRSCLREVLGPLRAKATFLIQDSRNKCKNNHYWWTYRHFVGMALLRTCLTIYFWSGISLAVNPHGGLSWS